MTIKNIIKLKWRIKMKKLVTAAALIGAISFAGIQIASAHGGRYFNDDNNTGYGCDNYYRNSSETSEKDQVAIEKFKADTSAIRKGIVVKRSELNAMMRKDNPDETKVAKLTGELYDLETEFGAKAEAAEIDTRFNNGYGPGMMQGYGSGRGGNMMGW